ncbi:MAG: glycosyltransferase [Sedimentisphaerales bacterium]|nr:glycosyltransferase [Sedimentisphaerales bacterium]
MKIAFIVSAFPCLSETFILDQITGLIDLGHEVEIFAERDPCENVIQESVNKYHLIQRTSYLPKRCGTRPGRILQSMRLAFCSFFHHPFRSLKSLLVLRRYLDMSALNFLGFVGPFLGKRFDIVHAHFGPNGLRSLCLKEIGLPAKYLTTFHGYDVTTYVREKGRNIYQKLFLKGDLFTYNSNATQKKLLDMQCPAEKIVKLPMGVHLNKLTFKERIINPQKTINILSVGRLVDMKGREYAIRAVAKVAEKYPNVRYQIAGDGPLREELQVLIQQLQMENVIRLHGWVSTEKLDALYNAAHIFLHPSVTASNGNMEGQGVVLIEAQACGLPVLATRHGAFPESVLDGQSGYLVQEKNVDALAEKLTYLIEHPETWPEMGRKGRKFVEKKFDIKVLNRKLVRIYQQMLSQKKKHSE